VLARQHDARLHRLDPTAARVREQRVRARERRQLLEVLDGGEDEQQPALAVSGQRGFRAEPREVDALGAVDARLRAGGQ
jgi:hypothetical protein